MTSSEFHRVVPAVPAGAPRPGTAGRPTEDPQRLSAAGFAAWCRAQGWTRRDVILSTLAAETEAELDFAARVSLHVAGVGWAVSAISDVTAGADLPLYKRHRVPRTYPELVSAVRDRIRTRVAETPGDLT